MGAQVGPAALADRQSARSRRRPGANAIGIVREYLFVSLFKACAESLASENASRLAAMQRAEKNIDELVVNLNQTFRRLRQSSIDEELFEVLSGYESASKGKMQ